jgi:hypothetical protein
MTLMTVTVMVSKIALKRASGKRPAAEHCAH